MEADFHLERAQRRGGVSARVEDAGLGQRFREKGTFGGCGREDSAPLLPHALRRAREAVSFFVFSSRARCARLGLALRARLAPGFVAPQDHLHAS